MGQEQPEKIYNILVGIPTMGEVSTALTTVLIKWAKQFKGGHLGFYFTFKVAPVERARNEIMKYMMAERTDKKTGQPMMPFTHILFLDSDTIPPANALEKLLSHDKDIISGLTPILQYDREKMTWGTLDNCFLKQDKEEDGKPAKTYAVQRNTGLQQIIRCGTSCLLIKREVFEKLEKPYFKFEFSEDGVTPVRSEDLYFCDKSKEAGFEIWCDSSVICNHVKEVVL